MIATVLLTGAFHEDGFADVCDGFGGGWTKEKILTIMKDSRIGAYGTIGIVFILVLKFMLLRSLNQEILPIVVVAAHTSSRAMAIVMTVFLPYARVQQSEGAVFKPFVANMVVSQGIVAMLFGVIPFLLFRDLFPLLVLLPMALVTIYLGRYFKKWIGGYTGDCCGATQQVTEIFFYLTILGFAWNSI